jgi:hypothetical protein
MRAVLMHAENNQEKGTIVGGDWGESYLPFPDDLTLPFDHGNALAPKCRSPHWQRVCVNLFG